MKAFYLLLFCSFFHITANCQTNEPTFYDLLTISQAKADALKNSLSDDQQEALTDFQYWKDYWSKRLSPTGNFKYYRHADSIRITAMQSGVRSGCEGNWSPLGPTGDPADLGPSTGKLYEGVGRIGEIRIDPNNSNYVLAGSPQGGLWKRDEAAGTSSLLNTDQLARIGVSAIAIDPTNSNKILIATGDDVGPTGWGHNTGSTSGIYYTTDGGLNWQASSLTFSVNSGNFNRIKTIVFKPGSSTIAWAVVHNLGPIYISDAKDWGGLYKSTDGGITWNEVVSSTFTNEYFWDIEFKPDNANTMYVGGHRLYKTTNGGTSWTDITGNLSQYTLTNEIGKYLSIAVPPKNSPSSISNTIVIGTISSTTGNTQIWYSTDGLTTSLNPATSNAGGGASVYHFSLNLGAYDNSGTPQVIIYLGGISFRTSTNSGATFTSVSSSIIHDDIRAIEVPKDYGTNSKTVYVGTDGGLSRSTDAAATVQSINQGIAASLFYSSDVSEFDGTLIGGTLDCFTMRNNSSGWAKVYLGGDGGDALVDDDDPNFMVYQDWLNNGWYYSIDGGATSPNYFTYSGNHNSPYPMIFDKTTTDKRVIVGYNKQYSKLSNGNTGYTYNDYYPGYSTTSTSNPLAIAQSSSNPDIIVVSLNGFWQDSNGITDENGGQPNYNDPLGFRIKNLYRTENNGLTWTNISPEIQAVSGIITSVVIDPTDDQQIWITCSGFSTLTYSNQNVFKSTDEGVNWTNYSDGLPQLPTLSLIYQEGSNDRLYVGLDYGIYYRDASMSQWSCFTNELPNVMISELAINYCEGKLTAGTFGRGMWETDLLPIHNTTSNAYQTTTGEIWSTNQRRNTDVVVPTGKTLTINNGAIISMARNTFIKVMPGAKLLIDGATVTNSCGYMWSGIQVVGNPAQPQSFNSGTGYYNYQGWLQMKNGAKIENAYVAAMADEAYYSASDYTYPNGLGTKGGGVIQAFATSGNPNCTINQCRNGIGFTRYPAQGYTQPPNKSYIKQTTFTCSGYLNPPYSSQYTNEFIAMWDVHGIAVYANTFNGATSAPVTLRGLGIHSIDADYRVLPTGGIPNTFNDVYRGVYAIVTNPSEITGSFIVDQNVFNGCSRSVYVSGFEYPSVTRNTANLTLSTTDTTYFLYSSASNYYSYEENAVTGQSQTKSYGIIVNNSGPYDNLVYKNSLTNLRYGCVSMNQNAGSYWNTAPGIGLQFKCNIYTNVFFNEAVYTCPGCPVYDGTIRRWQGYCDGTQAGPAGNQFISIPSGGYSLWKQNIPNIYYLHHSNTPYPPPPNIQNFAANDCGISSNSNTCPSNFCDPPCDFSSSSMMSEVEEQQTKGDSLQVEFIELSESSSSEEVLDSVAADYSESEQLLNAISDAEFEKQLAITQIVKYFIENEKADSALNYLLSIDESERALPLAIAADDFATAQDIIDKMEADEDHQINLRDYWQMILDQKEAGLSLRELNDDQIEQLRKWASQETQVGFLALNLLYLVNDEVYYEQIPIIESSDKDEKPAQVQSEQISFKLIPNPASYEVTALLSLSQQERIIDVFDFTGKRIEQFRIAPEQTSFIIQTNKWHEGIYLFKVNSGETILQSEKLLIVR